MTDYIEREAAEKRLFQRAEIANSAYIDQTPYQIMMLAQNVVHLIPAADVRPVVRAHWIMPNADHTDRPLPECSHCGWYVDLGGVRDFTYCPNCSAVMLARDK